MLENQQRSLSNRRSTISTQWKNNMDPFEDTPIRESQVHLRDLWNCVLLIAISANQFIGLSRVFRG